MYVFFITGCFVLLALLFLHGGTYGLAEDIRLAAGFEIRDSVDTIRVSAADLQELKRNYSSSRERMWAADLNESGFLRGLELIGVGNYTRVEAGELDGWRPDVLIHSHPLRGSARLSPYDKEVLVNRSHRILSDGGGVEDLFSASCILHRKWRFFSEPRLYCYANPVYSRMDGERREGIVGKAVSEGVMFDRVRVEVP